MTYTTVVLVFVLVLMGSWRCSTSLLAARPQGVRQRLSPRRRPGRPSTGPPHPIRRPSGGSHHRDRVRTARQRRVARRERGRRRRADVESVDEVTPGAGRRGRRQPGRRAEDAARGRRRTPTADASSTTVDRGGRRRRGRRGRRRGCRRRADAEAEVDPVEEFRARAARRSPATGTSCTPTPATRTG